MKSKILCLASLLVFSINAFSQSHEHHGGSPQQHAQRIVDQLCERIIIPSSKKDSLVLAFKLYYEDMNIYRDKGAKMMHALEVARDSDVHRILNDEQYKEYQTFLHELAVQRARESGKGHGGHGHH